MNSDLERTCSAIKGPVGEPLLRLLFAALRGEPPEAEGTTALVNEARGLGLLAQKRPSLTSLGFIVAAAAKDYCTWIDHARVMPGPRPPHEMVAGKDVVDIGCGLGRWLWEFQPTARSVVGVERQPEYLHLGRVLAEREGIPAPPILEGRAEAVATLRPPESADLVFSRLVFNYVEIRPALAGAVSVLRPDGVLWLQVESVLAHLRHLFRGEKRLRSVIWSLFGISNSLTCCVAGRQLKLRVGGRMHQTHQVAYPPLWWWRRALNKAGLGPLRLAADTHGGWAFWARKPVRGEQATVPSC